MKSLDRSELRGALLDPAILTQMGRIMVVDALIHNTDRLYGGVNLGNLMISADRRKLTAIDSQLKWSYRADHDFRHVKELVKADTRSRFLDGIVASIAPYFTGDLALTDLEKAMIKTGISQGVEGMDTAREAHLIELAEAMESRYRRDALPGGLKWFGRLRAKAGK